MSSKPDLIIPIRDRRQHRRILTLKNAAKGFIVVAAFLIGITIESNMRHQTSGNYGRILDKQVSTQTAVITPKYDVVKEPVADQTAADPLLVDAQRREEWLTVQQTTTAQTATPPNGVDIKRSAPQASQPLLSGGIFRQ